MGPSNGKCPIFGRSTKTARFTYLKARACPFVADTGLGRFSMDWVQRMFVAMAGGLGLLATFGWLLLFGQADRHLRRRRVFAQ